MDSLYRVIIAGGRDFNDYDHLKSKCDLFISSLYNIEVVSGCAKGADALGERYAEERGFKIKRFPADWENNGKAAGSIRNKQMAEYADYLIAFWDGHSKGTLNMLRTMSSMRKDKRQVMYNKKGRL